LHSRVWIYRPHHLRACKNSKGHVQRNLTPQYVKVKARIIALFTKKKHTQEV